MDLLAQHEAFLRAIYDAPADDTPRLVYADFLQENGEEDHAALIRTSIELSREGPAVPGEEGAELAARHEALLRKLRATDPDRFGEVDRFVRGFPQPEHRIKLDTSELANPQELRERMVRGMGCFGLQEINIKGPRLLTGHAFDVLFGLPALANVTRLDLSGVQQSIRGVEDGPDGLRTAGWEYVIAPVVTVLAVESLARHRGARRLTALDLRNNNLDNNAARALVKSPYLNNLTQLELSEGNQFGGRVWQQVIERFGEGVVG